MSQEYYILFYSTVLTNSIVNPRSHEFEVIQTDAFEAKQTEAMTRIKPKTSAALPIILYTVLYPLSYREVVAILSKMALKNPLCYLRQNRPESYFAVDIKINTTLKLSC